MDQSAKHTGHACSISWDGGRATSLLPAHHTPGPHPTPTGLRRRAAAQHRLRLLAAAVGQPVSHTLHGARRPDRNSLTGLFVRPADFKPLAHQAAVERRRLGRLHSLHTIRDTLRLTARARASRRGSSSNAKRLVGSSSSDSSMGSELSSVRSVTLQHSPSSARVRNCKCARRASALCTVRRLCRAVS
jgi:hypothetical protein